MNERKPWIRALAAGAAIASAGAFIGKAHATQQNKAPHAAVRRTAKQRGKAYACRR